VVCAGLASSGRAKLGGVTLGDDPSAELIAVPDLANCGVFPKMEALERNFFSGRITRAATGAGPIRAGGTWEAFSDQS